MDRQGIRELAAETLQVPTSPYRFAATHEEYLQAIDEVIAMRGQAVMSSSGKGRPTLQPDRCRTRLAIRTGRCRGNAGYR